MPIISRRTVTMGLAGTGLAVMTRGIARAESEPAASGAPTVKTAAGVVQGTTRDGAAAFLGIPYGAPTGGAGRFMPPRPPPSWTGVRMATSYGVMSANPLGILAFCEKLAEQPQTYTEPHANPTGGAVSTPPG